MDDFVSHRIQDQHFVLAFGYLSLVIILQLPLPSDVRHGSEVEKGFQPLSGLVADTGSAANTGSRPVLEWSNARVTCHFLGTGNGLHLIGTHQYFGRRCGPNPRNGGDPAEEFAQPGVTLNQNIDLGVDGLLLFFEGGQRFLRGGLDLLLKRRADEGLLLVQRHGQELVGLDEALPGGTQKGKPLDDLARRLPQAGLVAEAESVLGDPPGVDRVAPRGAPSYPAAFRLPVLSAYCSPAR